MRKRLSGLLALFMAVCCISFGCADEIEEMDLNDAEGLPGPLFSALGDSDEEDPEKNEDTRPELSPYLAVTGDSLWRIMDGEVLCAPVGNTRGAVSMPVPGYGETLKYTALLPYTADSVALITSNREETGGVQIQLDELALQDGEIAVRSGRDLTEVFSPFLGSEADWREVDLVRCSGGILIMALDTGFNFNLTLMNLETEERKDLGKTPLMLTTAAIPFGDQVLLAGFSVQTENAVDLTVLSLEDGEKSLLTTVPTGSASPAANFAYDEKPNLICFTIDNTAFRFSLDQGTEPEPFWIFEELPAEGRTVPIAGDQYIIQTEQGGIIPAKTDNSLDARRLTVKNIPGDEAVQEAAAAFNLAHPESFVRVVDGGEMSQVLTDMLNQAPETDVYTVDSSAGEFQALRGSGYFSDLGEVGGLEQAAEDMLPAVRSLMLVEGRPVLLPVSAEASAIAVNTRALSELTGVAEDALPRDWVGFLELLAQISEEGSLEDNERYIAGETGMSAAGFQEQLFSWILRDGFLWMTRENADPDQMGEKLLPVLRAFERVRWDRLGLPEDEAEDFGWAFSDEREMLISEQPVEIETGEMEPGLVFWPLSLSEGEEPAIPLTVYGLALNPYSENQDLARQWMTDAWEHLNVLKKMTLCQSMNEPVVNENYEADVAELEELLSMYEKSVEESGDPMETELLRLEKEDLESFLASYRENAYWSASEESIAQYRELMAFAVPDQPEFWSAADEDAAVLQYLDGMMPADQFVRQMTAALKMALTESK